MTEGLLSVEAARAVPDRVRALCAQLAPSAALLVDSFGIPEHLVRGEGVNGVCALGAAVPGQLAAGRRMGLTLRPINAPSLSRQVAAPIAGDWALYNTTDNKGELLGERW